MLALLLADRSTLIGRHACQTATHGPRPAGGRKTAQQHAAGLLKLDAQPSAARIRLPEARHGRSLPRSGELAFRTPTRNRARTGNLEGY